MAVMARALELPARVAVGYAPGERTGTGIYQVREKNAHAWAEVFFPGYGWQIFEATKSIAMSSASRGRMPLRPSGPAPAASRFSSSLNVAPGTSSPFPRSSPSRAATSEGSGR